jgi:hypothetical protein
MKNQAALFDPETKKVTPVEFSKWTFQDISIRKIAHDKIDEIIVSTVFLGMNHGWDDKPFWFETMVFGGPEEPQWRYETYDEAIVGHWKVVQFVKKGMT